MTPKQLKASILQLAIQGKLVPQDPKDEPASELLKRIKDAKTAKTAKKGKTHPPITDDEKPFPIPDSWEWVRLAHLVEYGRAITYGIIKLGTEDPAGVKVLRCSDVKPGWIDLANVRTVTKELSNEYKRTVLKGGEVLLNVRGTLGGCAVADTAVIGYNVAREVAVVPLYSECSSWYIAYLILSRYFIDYTTSNLHGIAYKGLNIEILSDLPVPLPPLAEQKRIVARVSALFKYVDECEDVRKELAEKLAETLKRSVLQEAIQGRLVPQDPYDEPASELLKRIVAEREKMLAEKKIKKVKPLPPIKDDEKPFNLPDGWEWARIGVVSDVFNGNSINEQIKKTKYAEKCDGYSFITTTDVGFDLVIKYESGVYIPKGEPKFRIAPKGSVLMCIEGGSAARKFGFLDRDVMFGNKLCCFVPTIMDAKFIYWYLQSTTFYSMFQGKMTGIIGGVGPETLRSFLIPLPPLAEQNRIVAKVEVFLAGIRSLRNLNEADAWVLNRRIEGHKNTLCEHFHCSDMKFEAHAQSDPTRHPFTSVYLEVMYKDGYEVDVEVLRKEVESIIGMSLDYASAPGVFNDRDGTRRTIFRVVNAPQKQ